MESRTGGKNGSISAVKKQMQRLFAARISLIELEAGNTDLTDYQSARFMDIARDATFWWSAKPGQASLFDTRIVLGERFYEAFKGGIPIDLRAMRALSQSPLELDLYCWLCYRLAYLRSPTTVPWEALQAQFGTITQESAKFRWMVRKALTSIAVVYPGAKFDSQGYTGLLLFPSAPAIAHKISRA